MNNSTNLTLDEQFEMSSTIITLYSVMPTADR